MYVVKWGNYYLVQRDTFQGWTHSQRYATKYDSKLDALAASGASPSLFYPARIVRVKAK